MKIFFPNGLFRRSQEGLFDAENLWKCLRYNRQDP